MAGPESADRSHRWILLVRSCSDAKWDYTSWTNLQLSQSRVALWIRSVWRRNNLWSVWLGQQWQMREWHKLWEWNMWKGAQYNHEWDHSKWWCIPWKAAKSNFHSSLDQFENKQVFSLLHQTCSCIGSSPTRPLPIIKTYYISFLILVLFCSLIIFAIFTFFHCSITSIFSVSIPLLR